MSYSGCAPVSSRSVCPTSCRPTRASLTADSATPGPATTRGMLYISSKAPMFLQYDPCAPRSSP